MNYCQQNERSRARPVFDKKITLYAFADRQRPGADRVAVQPDRLLREHQTAADVHAPVLVRREHDGRQEPGPVLRRRAPQADQVRRGRSQPRRLLHPARRARHVHAPVLRRRARLVAERRGQLRLVHRQRGPVFRRRYVYSGIFFFFVFYGLLRVIFFFWFFNSEKRPY